jgi:hypothetical protein
MRETMAERLKRQRGEYEQQINALRMELDEARELYLAEIKRGARLEAKLQMLAALLKEGP